MEPVIESMTTALNGFADQGLAAVAATIPSALKFVGISIVLGVAIGIFRKIGRK